MRWHFSILVILSVVLSATYPPTTLADAKVEEQDVGPVAQDAQYAVSPHGGHVGAAVHKGSRMIAVVDGVAGPKFDEIRSVTAYVDPRGVDLTQSRSLIKPVVFSNDGSRYAYCARQGQEFVVMADGKELLRTTVEHPDQTDVRMQFTGDDGKHLLFAVSGFAGYTLWVDGQKMPGTYNSGVGGTEGTTDPLVSRDGARYAYVAQISRDKRTVIVDGKDAGFVGDNLAFTADGHHLLALVRQGNVVWLAADGKPKMKTDGISQLVMAPEGNGFAAVLTRLQPAGEFLVVNAKKIEGSDCQSLSKVVFSADGKHFAALCTKSPSVKFVVVDGKKGQEYFDIPTVPGTPGIAFSPDASKLGYVAQAANKHYVVINDEESDGFDMTPGFAFSADGKHVAYGGYVSRPPSNPITVDGKADPLPGARISSFAFSPDGSRHADTGNGGVCVDGKDTGITGYFVFSPDSKHVAIAGRRGADNKAGLFVDGKLVYEVRSNFMVRYLAFTPDNQHLFWVAYEPPKDPTTSQGDFVSYLDGKPVAHYDNDPITIQRLDQQTIQPRVETGPDGVARMEHVQGATWQVGADGVLTVVGPVGGVVKRYRVTPTADTSLATLLAASK
jgi:hypothetical protein